MELAGSKDVARRSADGIRRVFLSTRLFPGERACQVKWAEDQNRTLGNLYLESEKSGAEASTPGIRN